MIRKIVASVLVSFLALGLPLSQVFAEGGFTWTQPSGSGTHNWYRMASSADGNAVIGAANGSYLQRSTDGGATWTAQTSAGTRAWRAVASSADGTVLAGVWDWGDGIWISTNSGTTWTNTAFAGGNGNGSNGGAVGTHAWAAISMSADGTHMVALENVSGSIWTSANSGSSWTKQSGAPVANWTAVSMSADGQKLAAGGTGNIYTSSDGGVTWAAQAGSGSHTWQDITMSADGVKLAAQYQGGNIMTSTNSGVAWTSQAGSGARTWTFMDSSMDGSNIVALADSGYIYVSTDSGVTWTQQTSAGSNRWYAVAMSANGGKIVAGQSNAGSQQDWIANNVTNEATSTDATTASGFTNTSLTTPAGSHITCKNRVQEVSLAAQDSSYVYPAGLVDFCFNSLLTNNQVTIIFETNLTPSQVVARYYNSTTHAYTDLTGAVVTQTTLNGNPALQLAYTLVDNGPFDTNASQFSIADPVGLGVVPSASSSSTPSSPNTGTTGHANNAAIFLIGDAGALGIMTGIVLLRRKSATSK